MNPYMPSKRGRSVDRLETEHPAQRIRRHTLRRRHSATSASGPEASNESDPTQPTAIEPDTDRSALNNTPSTSRTPNVENEVIFSLDFGTRYTTGKFAWVQNDRLESDYLDAQYFGNAEHLGGAAFIPSTVLPGETWKYGYQADANSEDTLRWIKLLLLCDNESGLSTSLRHRMEIKNLDEDMVLENYLGFIFKGFRENLVQVASTHISPLGPQIPLQIRAALPARGDGLARDRFTTFLRKAALGADFHVENSDIQIYVESTMAASSWINDNPEHKDALLTFHDGGAGTTNVDTLYISRDPSSDPPLRIVESIHCPPYLDCGGDEWERRGMAYFEENFPDFSDDNVVKDCWRTLCDRIKVALDWRTGDEKAKLHFNLLPPSIHESSFPSDIDTLFDTAYQPIVDYIQQCFSQGLQTFKGKHNEAPPYHLLISSGGQSQDPRMREKLRNCFGVDWHVVGKPRLSIVDGLAALNPQVFLPTYQTTIGFYGWTEVDKQTPGANKNHELDIWQKKSFIPLIQSGTPRILSQILRHPCNVAGPTSNICLPTVVTARQFRNGKETELSGVRIPRKKKKSGIKHQQYPKDQSSEALDYYTIEYAVTCQPTREGLLFCVLVIHEAHPEEEVARKMIEYGNVLGVADFDQL